MAKFIIEISDEQIRDLANADKLKEQAEKDKNPIKSLFDMIAGVGVSEKLDEGVTEFNISRDMMGDRDKSKELFDNYVGDICMLAFFAMKEGKSE